MLISVVGELARFTQRSPYLLWITTAVVGVISVALSAWWVMSGIVPLASNADAQLKEFRNLSGLEIVEPEDTLLAELQIQLDRFQEDVESAKWSVERCVRISPALSWMPGVSRELFTWSFQMNRLQTNVEATQTLITHSSEFMEIYQSAQSMLVTNKAPGSIALLTSRSEDLSSSFTTILNNLSIVANESRRRVPAFQPPGLMDAVALLDEVEGQMLMSSRIGVQASTLMEDLLEIGNHIQPLIGQFITNQGENEQLTMVGLRDTVIELDELLQFAIVKSDGIVRMVSDSGISGPFTNRLELIKELLEVLIVVNKATALGIQVSVPVIEVAQSSEKGLFGGGEQLVSALETVMERQEDIRITLEALENVRLEVGRLASAGEIIVTDLFPAIETLYTGLSLLKDFSSVGPELMGMDSTKRYLVLGQSADELRATGGFVSAIWVVTLVDAVLTDIEYYDVVMVDDWERLHLYPKAPIGLEEHMNAHVWLLRDVSWEPDFPMTARTAADMFRIGQRQEVDGVIALNQWTLLGVVQALQGIPSPEGGEVLNSRNLLGRLEQGSDEYGRAYMDLVLQGILQRLDDSLSISTLIKVASAVQTSLEERDLLLYVDDPDLESQIAKYSWDGRMRSDVSDYLFVVDSNVGWSKADRNIERTVEYEIDLSRESGPRIVLNLGYKNHSGPGSVGCEPQWLNRGINYSDLKNACYWNYWRVYVPQGARLLSSTPLPLPEHSVSVEIGKGVTGQDTLRVSSSYNKTVLSGLFALAAGDGRNVTLVYDLPSEVISRDGDDIHYQLVMPKQPGSRGRVVVVEFKLPEGYRLKSSSLDPATDTDSKVDFLMNENRDVILSAVFTSDDDV